MPIDTLMPPNLPKPPPVQPANGIAVAGQLVSIIIPCCGMLEYTQLCVPSILKHTRMPYELIFLDVGSLDGTTEYLSGLATGLQNVRVQVARSDTDLGIPRACREAVDKARGEFVVLLNNDTIVTRGWVNALIAMLSSSSLRGAAGPMSNNAAIAQRVEMVPYRSGPRKNVKFTDELVPSRSPVDVEAVQSFADDYREKNKGQWIDTDCLNGFCMMLKREVLRRLDEQGELSKWTDLGLFDTDILSRKIRQHGYTLAICRDLFVHHFGTRTFSQGAPGQQHGTNGVSGTTQATI